MEKDCMISHGAAYFLREKLFVDSDHFKTNICNQCGLIAISNPKSKSVHCNVCNTDNVYEIQIPYATKLLFQELMAMNIMPRLNIDKKAIK